MRICALITTFYAATLWAQPGQPIAFSHKTHAGAGVK